MKIGIEAHDLEGRRTGIGWVLFSLLKQWQSFDLPADLEFILYFKKKIPEDLELDRRFQQRILKNHLGFQSNALFMHCLLPRAAKEDKIDILFCPGYLGPIFYHGKMGLILHDIIYQAHPEWYNWPSILDKILLKAFSKISARKAKIIFTPSEFSQQEIIRCYQVNPNKIVVVPWGTDCNFKPIDKQNRLNQIKNKYRIKDNLFLYLGSIFNRRHLPEIIKAFEKIGSKLPNYQFLLVGVNYTNPFIDIDELVKQVNRKLNRPVIIRHDYIQPQDLPLLYNAADLMIYLSDYEGFGLPILEAMACGTPVITSPFTSIPEVAGDAAVYIQNSKNIQEISQTIYQVLTDEILRQKLIKQGLAQAEKFSWSRCAKKILDALLF